jgi:hypothetical protein
MIEGRTIVCNSYCQTFAILDFQVREMFASARLKAPTAVFLVFPGCYTVSGNGESYGLCPSATSVSYECLPVDKACHPRRLEYFCLLKFALFQLLNPRRQKLRSCVAPLFHIREFPGSNLGPEINSHDWEFSRLSSPLHKKKSRHIKPATTTSFHVLYNSLTSLSFNAILSELVT